MPPDIGTHFWDVRRGVIRSRIGGARIGEGVVFTHGYSILEKLVGNISFFQGMILNITGRMPDKRLADWMEATFLCLSWPDSRIWCNTVGALAGTTRTSPVSAVTAGVLASDSQIYGPRTMLMAAESMLKGMQLRDAGQGVGEIIRCLNRWPQKPTPVIPGYSRPISFGDERVPVMDRVARELGFAVGPYLELAYEIHERFQADYGESINLAGYMSAFLTDEGFSAEEIFRLYSLCVNGGIHACYAEAADQPAESYLPQRCDDVEYGGEAYRPVPD